MPQMLGGDPAHPRRRACSSTGLVFAPLDRGVRRRRGARPSPENSLPCGRHEASCPRRFPVPVREGHPAPGASFDLPGQARPRLEGLEREISGPPRSGDDPPPRRQADPGRPAGCATRIAPLGRAAAAHRRRAGAGPGLLDAEPDEAMAGGHRARRRTRWRRKLARARGRPALQRPLLRQPPRCSASTPAPAAPTRRNWGRDAAAHVICAGAEGAPPSPSSSSRE